MSKKVKRVYDENGNVTHKVCSKCGELKGIDEFSVCKSVSDGHQSKCKECDKKYWEENKEREKERKKKYREENKKQEVSKKIKRMYDENGNITHKFCNKCGEWKGIDEFNTNKGAPDGHCSNCKECKKKYRKENKERIKERQKKYKKKYKERNKERIKEYNKKYNKKYWEENKERGKERWKKYYEENKEQRREYDKKRYKESCDEAITRIKTIVEQDPTRYDYKVGEEIYGVIYLVYCKPANKYYVGQTTIGFDNRYPKGFFNDEDHKTNKKLMEDLEKYGKDSFEFTEIFKVAHSEKELDSLEIYYIDYFDSYYNGYNRTKGNLWKV